MHPDPLRHQSFHDFQGRDSPAEHDRAFGFADMRENLAGVGQIVQLDHALEVGAGEVGFPGGRPGRQQEEIIVQDDAGIEMELLVGPVDAQDGARDPMATAGLKLGLAVRAQLAFRDLPGQVIGQSRTGIVAVGLIADQEDFPVRVLGADSLGRADPGGAGANDHVGMRHKIRGKTPGQ